MPSRAENVTPGQSRHFFVEIEGYNPFQVQKVTIPKVSHEVVTVGDGQSEQKYPGMTKTDDLVIEDFVDAFHADDELLQWLFGNGDPETGTAAAPYDRRDGAIVRRDAALNEIQRWNFTNGWAKEIDGYSFDRTKSEAIMRKVTISVDSCKPVFGG